MKICNLVGYAVDKRKFLIYKSADETEQVAQEEQNADGQNTGHV